MPTLQKKIDFAIVIKVKNANPNGDPLNGNRPRIDFEGYGEMTDVCLKRKIRDRMLERFVSLTKTKQKGQAVFVQSDDRNHDGEKSLKNRAMSTKNGIGKAAFEKKADKTKTIAKACEKWLDVRSFGQVFAYGGDETKGVSIPVRGPVTIQSAFSVEPISSISTQITKSVSGEGDGSTRGSDTMGMKHRVEEAIYVTHGSMNPQLAERTGFSNEDAETIKEILPKLFENDESTARPAGSMQILNVVWWEHNCKSGQYSAAKVHRSLKVGTEGEIETTDLKGLKPEVIEGF